MDFVHTYKGYSPLTSQGNNSLDLNHARLKGKTAKLRAESLRGQVLRLFARFLASIRLY